VKATVWLAGAYAGLSSCYCGSKVCSFWKWVAATCTGPLTTSAGQQATSNCKPLLSGFPCKWWYIKSVPLTFINKT